MPEISTFHANQLGARSKVRSSIYVIINSIFRAFFSMSKTWCRRRKTALKMTAVLSGADPTVTFSIRGVRECGWRACSPLHDGSLFPAAAFWPTCKVIEALTMTKSVVYYELVNNNAREKTSRNQFGVRLSHISCMDMLPPACYSLSRIT